MYSANEKQFVFKQSSGKMFNFFYDERQGLCYNTFSKKNTWSEPVSLQQNTYKTFHADMDGDDTFHLMFQDLKGNIFYSKLDNRSPAKTSPILNSKLPAAYEKHLRMFIVKNEVHFFYVLQHGNAMILAHQLLTNGNISSPRVIDYVVDNNRPYAVVCDKSNVIHAFYQLSDGKSLQIGFKKYIPSQKAWSEFTPVTKSSMDCELPAVLADGRNILHLCCQRKGNRQYDLVYHQKAADKNIWTNECIIHTSAYPFENASILSVSDTITIFWVRNDVIYFSSSKDGGSSWSKPSKYIFQSARQLLCLSYKSNNQQQKDKPAFEEIPGNLIGGMKTAFFQEADEAAANLSTEDLKNMIIESLKMLKESIEELKESETRTRDQITRINQAYNELEKEVTKNTLRLGYIDNELNRLKTLESRAEEATVSRSPEPGDLRSNIVTDIFNSVMLQEINTDIRNLKNELTELKESLHGN